MKISKQFLKSICNRLGFKNSYKAAGFVETLIALAITGIAGILLITVAIRTLNQTVKNEINDEISTSDNNMDLQLEYLAEQYKAGNLLSSNVIENMLSTPGSCYRVSVDMQTPNSSTANFVCQKSFDDDAGILNRQTCPVPGTDVFTLVCVYVNNNPTSEIFTVDIISGFSGCDGNGCRDYVNKEIYLLK